MGLLTVRYEKGARVYLVGDRVSAEIDRLIRFDVADGQEYGIRLTDGPHRMVVRAAHCAKTVRFVMNGDLRLYVKWDRMVGGLMVSTFSGPETLFPRPGMYILMLFAWFASMISLPTLGLSLGQSLLVMFSSLVLILVPMFAVRSSIIDLHPYPARGR